MRTPNVCDVVTAPIRHGRQRFRVDGFYKRERLPQACLDNPATLSDDLLAQGALSRILDAAKCGRVSLISCPQDEAEFVSAHNTRGTVVRIEDCEVLGRVNWPTGDIAEEVTLQQDQIGRQYVAIPRYWQV